MKADFSIIQIIVYAGFLLTLINIFIHAKLKLRTPFARVVQLLNLYLALHFVFIWMVETIWISKTYLDQMAPFSLLYGTFLYVANNLTRNERISLRKMLPHLIIPAFFWLWFLIMLFQGISHTNMLYVRMRMIVAILTLSCYILGTILFNKKPILPNYRFVRPIIISGSIVLVIMVIIAIRVATRKILPNFDGVNSVRTIVYLCMFACAILVFRVQLGMTKYMRS
ncbi:MAG: hypothetical protein REI78_04940 [Pedobacter sp.]|nr:hypothetical protein [Pedobacter sp.]MDQ8052344.1 hypothetical protein [Pedobacter sp.]